MILLFLVYIILPCILCDTIPTKKYLAIQSAVLIIDHKKELLSLVVGKNDWPSFINYTHNISADSNIEIEMGFADRNESVATGNIVMDNVNICDILSGSIRSPFSDGSKYMIPEMLGLFGTECPIIAGVRNINPYKFPTLIELQDIGTGTKDFIINIFDNKKSEPMITVISRLDINYYDEITLKNKSCHSGSSILAITPSVITLIAVTFLSKFILQ